MYNSNQFFNGRQPYYMPANYQMPLMTQQQPNEVISDIRFLTADQIKGFIPPINSRVLLIDKSNSLAYIETTDNMGNMYKEAYSFSPVKNETKKEEQKQDLSIYATKQELESIRKELETLRKPSQSTPSRENVQAKQ